MGEAERAGEVAGGKATDQGGLPDVKRRAGGGSTLPLYCIQYDFCTKLKPLKKKLRFEQSPPSTLTSLRALQQIPPHPGDFDPKFPSALLDIEQHQTGELLWRYWRSAGEYWRAAPARYWPDTRQDPPARDTQRDTRRDPLASRSGGILGGIHWRAALAGYSAASTGEPLWRDTRQDPLTSRSGSAGSTGEPLWTGGQDPLASHAGGILVLASCFGGILGGILSRIHWRAALAGHSAGSTGEQLWRDTRRDPLASSSGGILGGVHWRAALVGCLAGTRDPLASRSGGILGGIHWRAALAAGYSG